MAKITSVIDIGSNSVRLAIFQKTSRYGFALIYELKAKVRISEGSYENGGNLQEIPMKRTISALTDFVKIIQRYKSKKVFCVATSAVRDAPNNRDFLKRVKDACGLQVKVLDGIKESFYGGIACANLSHRKDGIMIDIGGGSTELAVIKDGSLKEMISLDLGTIRLKELFLDKRKDKRLLREYLNEQLSRLKDSFKHTRVFGVGGSIRALAKLCIKQSQGPIDTIHGFEISVKKLAPLMEKIINAKEDKLKDLCISEERLDSIQGGIIIFNAILERLDVREVVICGVGVREGVFLADLLRHQKYRFPKNENPSLNFIKDHLSHHKFARQMKAGGMKIYNLLSKDFGLDAGHQEILKVVFDLLLLGVSTDFYHANKHAAYRAKYMLKYGFSHSQRALVALLLEFSERKLPKESDLQRYHQSEPLACVQILSFIVALARTLWLASERMEISIEYKDKTLYLHGSKESFLLQERLAKLSVPKNLDFILR